MTWRRCHVTKNECGSDTWGNGYTCPCLQCQAWLAEQCIAALTPEEQRARWEDAFPPPDEIVVVRGPFIPNVALIKASIAKHYPCDAEPSSEVKERK